MKFLSDEDILSKVKNFCARRKPLQIAVSYWGKGALEETGLRDRIEADPSTVQVICDLWSGACNPAPIRQLIKSGVRVKTLDHFHAKVWVCARDILIGSANVSSNGLGFENSKSTENNIEAAVIAGDREFAVSVRCWFEDQWKKKQNTIELEEVTQAQRHWNERKHVRDLRRAYSTTLLQKVETDRKSRELANVRVIAWEQSNEDTPKRRIKDFEKQSEEYFEPFEEHDHRWFYDFSNATKWEFAKGNIYLDFTIPYDGNLSQLKFNGIFRIVSDSFLSVDGGRKLVFYYQDATCRGHWFPKKEQRLLRNRILEHIRAARLDEPDRDGHFLDEKLTVIWKK